MTIIYAHRGYTKGVNQENTIEAFREAKKLDLKAIELDVHLTLDKRWLINHGSSISGVSIKNLNSADIVKFNHTYKTNYCFLDEILEEFKNQVINIEIKPNSTKIGFELAKFVAKYGNTDIHHISSFKLRSLFGARKYSSDIKLSLNSFYSRKNTVLRIHDKLKLFSFNPFYLFLNKNYIDTMHENNLQIHVWTVNRKKDIQRMLNYNVDAIISDNPIIANSIKMKIISN